jgi:hypothetical protein
MPGLGNILVDSLLTDIAHVGGDMTITPGGDIGTVSGLANYRLALFHRLVTVPGTLIHKPTYGVGVGNFQNSPSTFANQQKLADLIQEQFALDPRTLSINSVSFEASDDQPWLGIIKVFVTPIGYTEQAMIFKPFNGGAV